MAVYKRGINGPFSGKAGSVIGSSWRKVDYMKGLSEKHKPETPEQIAQQDKWKIMVAFLAPLAKILETGLNKEDTRRKTAYNLALSYNLRYAVKETEEGFEIDYPNVLLSRGSLPRVADAKVERESDDKFVVSWSPLVNTAMVSADDEVTVLMYCPQKTIHIISFGEYERRDGKMVLAVPEELHNMACHFFIFFTSVNGNNSPAQYLGEGPADL